MSTLEAASFNPGDKVACRLTPFDADDSGVAVTSDLATVVNGVTNAHQVVHPDNHSSSDRRSMAFVPAVVPALTGLRAVLSVVSDEGSTPPNVALEWTIRVRDERGIIVADEDAWELPEPVPFLPSSVTPPE